MQAATTRLNIAETIVIMSHAFFFIKEIEYNQRSVVNHQQQGGVVSIEIKAIAADTMHQPAADDDHKRRLYTKINSIHYKRSYLESEVCLMLIFIVVSRMFDILTSKRKSCYGPKQCFGKTTKFTVARHAI